MISLNLSDPFFLPRESGRCLQVESDRSLGHGFLSSVCFDAFLYWSIIFFGRIMRMGVVFDELPFHYIRLYLVHVLYLVVSFLVDHPLFRHIFEHIPEDAHLIGSCTFTVLPADAVDHDILHFIVCPWQVQALALQEAAVTGQQHCPGHAKYSVLDLIVRGFPWQYPRTRSCTRCRNLTRRCCGRKVYSFVRWETPHLADGRELVEFLLRLTVMYGLVKGEVDGSREQCDIYGRHLLSGEDDGRSRLT